MRSDSDIYNSIGKILFRISPKDACKVIMRAELSGELDTCQYEYDSIDKQGNIDWFTASGRANLDMLECLIELRAWYAINNLASKKKMWNKCAATADLINSKIAIDFIYP